MCSVLQGLERRSEFVKAFRDAEISGLHLLELAPTEMSGIQLHVLFM